AERLVPPEPRVKYPNVPVGAALDGDRELAADAIVVGSGAGGAMAAARIRDAGLDVLVLEEGGLHRTETFSTDPATMIQRLYRDAGTTMIFGKPGIIFAEGKCVGGSTVINGGMSWRTPERVLDHWERSLGLDATGPRAMEPYFAEAERILHTEPNHEDTVGGNTRLFLDGAHRPGWPVARAPRNMRRCLRLNNCASGCPTGAKQALHVTGIPPPLAAAAARPPRRRAAGARRGARPPDAGLQPHAHRRRAHRGRGRGPRHPRARPAAVHVLRPERPRPRDHPPGRGAHGRAALRGRRAARAPALRRPPRALRPRPAPAHPRAAARGGRHRAHDGPHHGHGAHGERSAPRRDRRERQGVGHRGAGGRRREPAALVDRREPAGDHRRDGAAQRRPVGGGATGGGRLMPPFARPDGTPSPVHPLRRIMPFLLPTKNGAFVLFEQHVDAAPAKRFLAELNAGR